MRSIVEFFFGHLKPGEYGDYFNNPANPFKDDNDQWARDPFYRHGIFCGFFTRQFVADPVGCLWRKTQAMFMGQ